MLPLEMFFRLRFPRTRWPWLWLPRRWRPYDANDDNGDHDDNWYVIYTRKYTCTNIHAVENIARFAKVDIFKYFVFPECSWFRSLWISGGLHATMSPALLVQVRRFINTLNFILVKDAWRNEISSLPCWFLDSGVCLVDFLTVESALLMGLTFAPFVLIPTHQPDGAC